jgi:hypothetical protein
MRYILAVFVLSVASLSVCQAAEDPFNGDWRPSQSKAKSTPDGLVTQSLHIESTETDVYIVHKRTSADGAPMRFVVRAAFAGEYTTIQNSPEMDYVRCWRSGPRTILVKLFNRSVATGFWAAEVAKNGRALKVTTTTFDADGKESNTVNWFDKEQAEPAPREVRAMVLPSNR